MYEYFAELSTYSKFRKVFSYLSNNLNSIPNIVFKSSTIGPILPLLQTTTLWVFSLSRNNGRILNYKHYFRLDDISTVLKNSAGCCGGHVIYPSVTRPIQPIVRPPSKALSLQLKLNLANNFLQCESSFAMPAPWAMLNIMKPREVTGRGGRSQQELMCFPQLSHPVMAGPFRQENGVSG